MSDWLYSDCISESCATSWARIWASSRVVHSESRGTAMATSVVAVVFADTFAGRFVAVPAEVDRAVRLFGDALAGAVFFVGAVRAAAARLGRAVVAFACGLADLADLADLAGAAVAFFFGNLATLVLAAGPVAFAVLRAV